MKKLFIIIMFIGIFQNLNAEELIGVSISYNAVKPLEYSVVYKAYSDKYPIQILDTKPLKSFTFVVSSGKNSVKNFPTLIKKDSFTYHFKADRGCYEYTYTDTINLNDPKFYAIKNSGDCKVYFGITYPERFQTLANLPTGSYYTYAFVNMCLAQTNNSPTLPNFRTYVPCKKPVKLDFHRYSDLDYDSLGLEFINPKSNKDSSLSFKSGYSRNRPFGSDTIYSDLYGDLVFVPQICDNNYVNSFEIKEYRKIGNQYKEIGGVVHDFVLKIILSLNNPPTLFGPYKYVVDAGNQICFTIISDDKPFIPPPPIKEYTSDTIHLTWNMTIPGATFTIVDPKSRLKSGKFCWTPKLSQANDLVYNFIVTATDNSWLYSEKTEKSYTIKVNTPVNSVQWLHSSKISIAPNPTIIPKLSIFGTAIDEVQIFSLTGKLISKWEIPPTNHFYESIDLISSGFYIVLVRENGSYQQIKWIKQ